MDKKKKDIPKHWKWVTLDDVSKKITDGSHNPPKGVDFGIPMLSARNIQNNLIDFFDARYLSEEDFEIENQRTNLEALDILLTTVGTIGRTALVPYNSKFVLQRSVTVIKPLINPKYLLYYFQSSNFQKELIDNATGTAQKGIYLNVIKRIEVPLAPIEEQERIVEKVEELFSELDTILLNFEFLYTKSKIYWFSEINSFFRGKKGYTILGKVIKPQKKLDKIEEKRTALGKKYTGKNDIDNKNVINYDLPTHWRLVKLSDLYIDPVDSITDGPFGSNLKSSDFQETGFPVLKIQNIDRNKFISKDISYVSEEKFNQLDKHQFKNGDIVITKLGSPLGKACIVPNNFDKGVIVADLIRIKESEYINSKFLMYSLNSPYIISQIEKLSKGTTRQRVTLRDIRNLVIIFPSIEEQELIVNNIEELDDEINGLSEIINQSCLTVQALKQKILQDAFNGSFINEEVYEENIEDYLEQILIEKEEYLIKLKEQQKNIIKTKRFNVSMDILEILEKEENPISSHALWQKSIYKNDIEEFYKRLKELESKIRELKEGHLSSIELIK